MVSGVRLFLYHYIDRGFWYAFLYGWVENRGLQRRSKRRFHSEDIGCWWLLSLGMGKTRVDENPYH